jgi:diguanylate cyclase (GGDEF)-like protein
MMSRSSLSVLLVEDSEDDYIITRDLFSETEDCTINLEWVNNYDSALERIGQKCHDVYVFDYYLGQHTGVELLEWAVEHGVRAPVILLTGQREREIDLQAMMAGATDYLVKGRTDASLLERTVRYAHEHARRLDTLHDLATRDELTGLNNRREMDRLLHREVSRCQRYSHPLSLIILDIDNFKSINDTFGHLAGDYVLRTISQLLAEQLRSTDSIARYGGDELALILPETSENGTSLIAERMRLAVAAHDFGPVQPSVHSTGHLGRLSPTISLGVACAGTGIYTAESLFAAADRALYQAKLSGRNCTVSLCHAILTTVPLTTLLLPVENAVNSN